MSFRKQLQDKRQDEKAQSLEARLDKAIGKDFDATLVPNYRTTEPRETEEVFPDIDSILMSDEDRVNFTNVCKSLADVAVRQEALNNHRRKLLHEAKKIAQRNGITKAQAAGHKFRLWTI